MSNILDRIIADKKLEIRQRLIETPISRLEKSPYFKRTPISLKESLMEKKASGIKVYTSRTALSPSLPPHPCSRTE